MLADSRPRPAAPAAVVWLTAAVLVAGAAAAGDWPQWMGADGNGVSITPGLFLPGSSPQLAVAWRLPLGQGYSSVSVAGGRAFTTFSEAGSELLIAVDAGDGRELWRHGLDLAAGKRPLSTPAVNGGRVFAISSGGRLHAVDAADGRLLWAHDLAAELGAQPPTYGVSTSPVLIDGMLLVLVGGREAHSLVAFEPASGEIVWSVFHAGVPSYATPVAGTLAGERQIVVPAGDRLYAVRLSDGGLLWSHDGLGYPDRNPLLLGDRVFLPLETTAVMLAIERDGGALRSRELWRTESLWFSYSPVVHRKGSLYGLGKDQLVCLDVQSGAVRWRRRLAEGSLILVDGHLVVLEQMSGRLRVVAADPSGFRERVSLDVLGRSPAFAPPSFGGRTIFVRNHQEMVAVDVLGQGGAR